MAQRRPSTQRQRAFQVVGQYRLNDRVEQVLQVMREHDYGVFVRSAGLLDECMTDDRIQGVFGTRIGAVLSAPMKFEPAGTKRVQAKVAAAVGGADDQPGCWQHIFSQSTAAEILKWGIGIGIGVGEIAWELDEDEWCPRVIPWHPQFLRWDWMLRRFVLQTEGGQVVLPRPDEEPRGDGKWIVYCPYGVEYGWRSAIIRSLCWKYLSRQWSERDFDRWCERQGLGMIVANTPTSSTPSAREAFFNSLQNIGSEAAVHAPQGADGKGGYSIEIKEFVAQTWQGMQSRRGLLDTDIAIALLGQNLTTEVKEGSLAAGRMQNLIRIDYALRDAGLGPVVGQQVLSWWAEYNYGDPDLAPVPIYEVEPPDDDVQESTALKMLGDALQSLQLAEPRVDTTAIAEQFGVPLISEEELAAREADEAEKRAEAAAAASGGGQGAGGAGGDGGPGGGQPGAPAPDGGAQPPGGATALTALDVRKRYSFAGLPIAVENPVGSIRLWPGGSTKMSADYGFVEGYLGGDGEELDCYIGPDEAASEVYVVHQLRAPDFRAHDEDKIFLGFPSANAAKACFLAHRNDGLQAFGGMSVIPLDRFKAKLARRAPETTTKIRASMDIGRAVPLARTAAGERRHARYQDTLTARSIRHASRALGPDLAAMTSLLGEATSLSDLRKRIIRYYKTSKPPEQLADLITKTLVLAKMSGRYTALEQALK